VKQLEYLGSPQPKFMACKHVVIVFVFVVVVVVVRSTRWSGRFRLCREG
jgi:hypothetical protein